MVQREYPFSVASMGSLMKLKHWTALPMFAVLITCAVAQRALTDPRDADPAAVAGTLIDVTTTICIPYVIDGVSIGKLVQQPGISKRIDYVHGVNVTRYDSAAPGKPTVTPDEAKDYVVGPDGRHDRTSRSCRVSWDASADLARIVLKDFRDHLALSKYKIYPGHAYRGPCWPKSGVLCGSSTGPAASFVCIRNKGGGIITTSGPDYPFLVGSETKEQVEIDVSGPEGASLNCN